MERLLVAQSGQSFVRCSITFDLRDPGLQLESGESPLGP